MVGSMHNSTRAMSRHRCRPRFVMDENRNKHLLNFHDGSRRIRVFSSETRNRKSRKRGSRGRFLGKKGGNRYESERKREREREGEQKVNPIELVRRGNRSSQHSNNDKRFRGWFKERLASNIAKLTYNR